MTKQTIAKAEQLRYDVNTYTHKCRAFCRGRTAFTNYETHLTKVAQLAQTPSHICKDICLHTRTRTLALKHTSSHARTHSLTHTHTHKHTRMHARTHARTHTHTHARTHTHTPRVLTFVGSVCCLYPTLERS